jgi:hypothetical protein
MRHCAASVWLCLRARRVLISKGSINKRQQWFSGGSSKESYLGQYIELVFNAAGNHGGGRNPVTSPDFHQLRCIWRVFKRHAS